METSFSTSAEKAPAAPENWWSEVGAVLQKDLRSEWRTKSAVSTILMFCLTCLMVLSIFLVTTGRGLSQRLDGSTGDTNTRASILSGLFWVILYFSAMAGLPRSFVKEEEMGTGSMLRLTARPTAVLGGKLLFNVLLLELVAFLSVPVFVLFFHPTVRLWGSFLAHVAAGSAGIAGTATLLAAIVARSSNRGYLMAILGFGPLLPVLGFSINGTTAAFYGDQGNNLIPLVSYLVVMSIASGFLFEHVWRD